MQLLLFPYQIEGANFLAARRVALLADEMGLGKSAQAIKACELVGAKRILVICRAVARSNWRDEFVKFSRFNPDRDIHAVFSRVCLPNHPRDGVFIVSYEALCAVLHMCDTQPGFTFDVVIADESHYLKEPAAKRTQNVFGNKGIVRKTKRTWCLTGTPAPNHFGELWPMLFTFGKVKLGFEDFVDQFCEVRHTGFGRQIVGTKTDVKSLDQIHGLLKTIALRRTKAEVATEMPPLTFQTFAVEKSPVDCSLHSGFAHFTVPATRIEELNKKLEKEQGIIDAVLANGKMSDQLLELVMATSASVSTLRRYTALQKMPAVIDLIYAELKANAYKKIVVFCLHRDCVEGMRYGLREFKPVTLYGGTKPEKAAYNIQKFQNVETTRVFIANIHAAGTSVNLTAANQIVFLEQSWVPGDNAQAASRCHRIGQKEAVNVRIMALADSIDAKVAKVLEKKMKEISKIFEKKIDSVDALF